VSETNIPGCVRAARAYRGWTQAELAERAGVHRMTLSRCEDGTSIPGSATLDRIARALGVTADALLSRESIPLMSHANFDPSTAPTPEPDTAPRHPQPTRENTALAEGEQW
jgi:putative transcriptional regulator